MAANQYRSLQISTGEFPLHEYRLGLAGCEWSILYTGAILTYEDELHFFKSIGGAAKPPQALTECTRSNRISYPDLLGIGPFEFDQERLVAGEIFWFRRNRLAGS
jgi:hypothetical protein